VDSKKSKTPAWRARKHPEASRPETGRAASPEGVTRRRAIRRLFELLAGTVAAACLPGADGPARGHEHSILPAGESTSAQSPAAVFFNSEQRATVSAVVDLIIPPDDVSPGAKAAGVANYVEFLAANAPPETQQAWLDGLRGLGAFSQERAGKTFTALSPDQQEILVSELAGFESSPQTGAQQLFVRIKRATAEGFYTSKIGLLDDLKYQGNTYVDGPATCQDQFAADQGTSCPSSTGDSTE
jgi:gluconate 2-dehydrogenase gamma chain